MTANGRSARKRILVIVNPTAGHMRQAKLKPVIDRLEAYGCTVTVYETKAAGDAERSASRVEGADFDAIVAAGGDGTINEVLNGLSLGAPPLAIMPLGTANVLAKEMDLSESIDDIAKTIAFGPAKPISIGDANGRRFAVMASVGLDAEVVENVNLSLKRFIGKWAYAYETLKQLFVASPTSYRLRIDQKEGDAQGVIVANGRFYGGRYVAAPNARLEQPSLEVCHLLRRGRLAAPRYLMSLWRGRLAERADVRVDQATGLEILGPAGAPLQADGDVLCRLPATIHVLPAAVELIFPLEGPVPEPAAPGGSTAP